MVWWSPLSEGKKLWGFLLELGACCGSRALSIRSLSFSKFLLAVSLNSSDKGGGRTGRPYTSRTVMRLDLASLISPRCAHLSAMSSSMYTSSLSPLLVNIGKAWFSIWSWGVRAGSTDSGVRATLIASPTVTKSTRMRKTKTKWLATTW